MADENMELVSKAELKELRTCKRKLVRTEAERQRDKKKLKKLENLKALVKNEVMFRPKRTRIHLTVHNCAKLLARKKFEIWSESKQVAGFRWQLRTKKKAEKPDSIGLQLFTDPPRNYNGSYEFDVEFTLRVLNVSSSEDIHRGPFDGKFDQNATGHGFDRMANVQELLDPDEGFLRPNGDIKFEVDFTVKTATLDHFLTDEEENTNEESDHAEEDD